MNEESALVVFQNKKIRRIWYNNEWHFSVVDVVEVLSESPSPRQYWSVLKGREPQLLTFCLQLKLQSTDGKYYRAKDDESLRGIYKEIAMITDTKVGKNLGISFLVISLILVLIEWVMINTKYRTIP